MKQSFPRSSEELETCEVSQHVLVRGIEEFGGGGKEAMNNLLDVGCAGSKREYALLSLDQSQHPS